MVTQSQMVRDGHRRNGLLRRSETVRGLNMFYCWKTRQPEPAEVNRVRQQLLSDLNAIWAEQLFLFTELVCKTFFLTLVE